ncbi:MAG: hypothetical protein ABH859_07910 [Pseudomonadota bacterium]
MKKILALVFGVSLLSLATASVSLADDDECVCGMDPETGECMPCDDVEE